MTNFERQATVGLREYADLSGIDTSIDLLSPAFDTSFGEWATSARKDGLDLSNYRTRVDGVSINGRVYNIEIEGEPVEVRVTDGRIQGYWAPAQITQRASVTFRGGEQAMRLAGSFREYIAASDFEETVAFAGERLGMRYQTCDLPQHLLEFYGLANPKPAMDEVA